MRELPSVRKLLSARTALQEAVELLRALTNPNNVTGDAKRAPHRDTG